MRRRHPSLRAVLSLLVVVIAVNIPFVMAKYAMLDQLPAIRGVRPDRLLQFAPFFVVVLAGMGLNELMKLRTTVRTPQFWPLRARPIRVGQAAFVIGLGAVAVLNLIDKADHAVQWVRDGSYERNFGSPVLEEFAEEHPAGTNPFRVGSYQMHGAIAAGYGLETVDGKLTIVPNRYREFWGLVIARYLEKDQRKHELFWGTSSGSVLSLFDETPSAQVIFADNYNLEMLSLAGARYLFSRDQIVDQRLVPIHEPPAPWNSMGRREKIRTAIRENFTGRELLYIYKNESALPRAFVVGEVTVFEGKEALLEALASADISTLRSMAFFNVDDIEGVTLNLSVGGGNAAIRRYDSDVLEVDVSSEGAALLVITNSFAKFWKCYVDDRETKILPAYHAFWGIPIPAGARTVKCTYSPPYRLF
jgi:hypothetical protein